jgi:hypothetical protein
MCVGRMGVGQMVFDETTRDQGPILLNFLRP